MQTVALRVGQHALKAAILAWAGPGRGKGSAKKGRNRRVRRVSWDDLYRRVHAGSTHAQS